MRVLTAPGHGFGHVVYSTTGRHLSAQACFSTRRWIWDLSQAAPGTKLSPDDVRLAFFDLLKLSHGSAFLRVGNYWPDSEEWPVGEGLRIEHFGLKQQLGGSFRKRCFTPDGLGLLQETVGPLYRTADQLAVWDFSGKIVRRYRLEDPAWGPKYAAFSDDGRLLALVPFTHVDLRDANTDDRIAKLEDGHQEITDLAFSPDGRWLATAAGRIVRLWDASSGRLAHRFRAFQASSFTVAFTPDNRLLAAGSREGRLRIWEVLSGRELIDLQLGKKDIHHLAFAPDGHTIAAACRGKCVVVVDVDF